jgi:DNA replication protein DnaC
MKREPTVARKELEQTLRHDARLMFFSNDAIDEFVTSATMAEMRTVANLLAHQMEIRAKNQLAQRMRQAKFPAIKSFEGYDFSQIALPEGYSVESLKSLEFIKSAQDFVFHGQTGRGKTHLAIAIGLAAVKEGKRVRFFTVAELVMHLVDANRAMRLEKMLSDIARCDLVILDELGYIPLDIEGARLLYQVMANAYEKQSLIITTNIEFSKWGTIFGDDKLAAAVIDRIVHHGRLIEFNGASHRMNASLMLGKGDS